MDNVDFDMGEEDFLSELNSDKFIPIDENIDKEAKKQQKSDDKEMKLLISQQQRDMKREIRENKQADLANMRAEKKQEKINKKNGVPEDGDDLFSGNATPILGKEKLLLMKKVAQYKSLFPEELKSFKIKKNPNALELSQALEEMSVLVEVGSMDGFLMYSVFSCMLLVEGASTMTHHDIRGCADLLKQNKEFHKLCKTLFIKYNVFSSVPPEFQLILLVSTTAFMCSNKNKQKGAINDYLNAPV